MVDASRSFDELLEKQRSHAKQNPAFDDGADSIPTFYSMSGPTRDVVTPLVDYSDDDGDDDDDNLPDLANDTKPNGHANGHASGTQNGSSNGHHAEHLTNGSVDGPHLTPTSDSEGSVSTGNGTEHSNGCDVGLVPRDDGSPGVSRRSDVPDAETMGSQIKDALAAHTSPRPDDKPWHLVSQAWWKSFCLYSKYSPPGMFDYGDDLDLYDEGPLPDEDPKFPGPLNNQDLIEDVAHPKLQEAPYSSSIFSMSNKTSFSMTSREDDQQKKATEAVTDDDDEDDNHGSDVSEDPLQLGAKMKRNCRLKTNIGENSDFTLLPSEVGDKLYSWFGGGPIITRPVYPAGKKSNRNTNIDIHGLKLRASYNAKPSTVILIHVSKGTTLAQFVKAARAKLQVPESSEVTPCNYRSGCNRGKLVAEEGDVIGDLSLDNDQRVLLMEEGAEPSLKIPTTSKKALLLLGANGSSTSSSSNLGAGSRSYNDRYTSGSGSSSSYGGGGGYGSHDYNREDVTKGLTGLNNIGNTCFMNSGLQCLSNTYALTEYFLHDGHVHDINEDNPIGMGGQLATEYAALVKELWAGKYRAVNPRNLKYVIGKFAQQFMGYAQQDSQELLAFLLDGLHEDLNRVRKKQYVEQKDSDGRPDHEVADESWDNHKVRNDSEIVDLFQGQLKSKVQCPTCAKVSITFDPFMYMSLPLKNSSVGKLVIVYVVRHKSHTFKYGVHVPKNVKAGDFLQKVATVCATDPSRLVLASVIVGGYHDDKHIDKLYRADHDLFDRFGQSRRMYIVYELPSPLADDEVVVKVFQQHTTSSSRSMYSSVDKIGFPFVVTLPKDGIISYEALREKVWLEARRFYREPSKHQRCSSDEESDDTHDPMDVELNGGSSSDDEGDAMVIQQPDRMDEEDDTNANNKRRRLGVEELKWLEHISLKVYCSSGNFIRRDLKKEHVRKQEEEERERRLQEEQEEKDVADENKENSAGSSVDGDCDGSEKTSDSAKDVDEARSMPRTYNGNFRQGSDKNVRDGGPLQLRTEQLSILWDDEAFERFDATMGTTTVVDDSAVEQDPTLGDCFRYFTEEEKLNAGDEWYCSNCEEHKQATKKFDLWRLPDYLVVHLKRFAGSSYTRRKLETMVDFPVEGLDLSPYAVGPTRDGAPPIYDLYAVSNHFGGMGGGHYTAYALNHTTKEWYSFDDSSVRHVVRASEVVSTAAYVLFYRKRKNDDGVDGGGGAGSGPVDSDVGGGGDVVDDASDDASDVVSDDVSDVSDVSDDDDERTAVGDEMDRAFDEDDEGGG
eukprot:TRINITY_DN5224_c0_g1_i1.p1 TRINITY_DN5224_c0_g1~~TRINITY_DN5224_c0_g1_i1.p1  ORF type:complete len:1284 (+),score=421.09 TRINITY_DN5224_c0_g1_i1:265-4116(+)